MTSPATQATPNVGVGGLNTQPATIAGDVNFAGYFRALSMFETGDNDQARGREGERSRYQITRAVWQRSTALPFSDATNAVLALAVAESIMFDRTGGKAVSASEFARLWHCPHRQHLRRRERDYIARFCNLVNKLNP